MKKSLLALVALAAVAMSSAALAADYSLVHEKVPIATQASEPAAQRAEQVNLKECTALIRAHAQAPHIAPARTVARICRGEPQPDQAAATGLNSWRPTGIGLRMPSHFRHQRYLT